MPPCIRRWVQDGEARTWAPTELADHSTLPHGAALHAAYGALATMHHPYALAVQQRAIEAGCARAVPSEESDSNRDVPPGWVQRVMLYVAFGTNASIARVLVIASAAVFMPVVPGAKFGYVMPARCVPNAHTHRVRARVHAPA